MPEAVKVHLSCSKLLSIGNDAVKSLAVVKTGATMFGHSPSLRLVPKRRKLRVEWLTVLNFRQMILVIIRRDDAKCQNSSNATGRSGSQSSG